MTAQDAGLRAPEPGLVPGNRLSPSFWPFCLGGSHLPLLLAFLTFSSRASPFILTLIFLLTEERGGRVFFKLEVATESHVLDDGLVTCQRRDVTTGNPRPWVCAKAVRSVDASPSLRCV